MRHLFYLQQFFERFPAPAFIKDNKLRYVWINKEWEKFFGIIERKVIGKTNKKLFGEDIHEEIDKKVIKTKKAVTYKATLGNKHLLINKIPIRLGDGTYGVAGFILDETERYLYELSLQGLIKINEVLRDLLLENYNDRDSFIIDFFENLYKRSQMGPYAILKENKENIILKSYLPEKVCQRAFPKSELKEFSVDNEKWIVIPIAEYKLLLKSTPNYYKIIKNLYPTAVSKIENVLDSIERKLKQQLYYKALEKMVDFVVSWRSKDLKSYCKKALEDIMEIIPEAEKGSVWILNENKYKCIAEIGYPGAESLNFSPSKTAYGTEIVKKIQKGEKVFEIENAKELVQKSELKDVLSSYGMNSPDFIPLIGVFKIGNKIIGNISLDNFSGKHFSDESKKLLNYFVDILTAFLSEKF